MRRFAIGWMRKLALFLPLGLVGCGNDPREFTNRTPLSQQFLYTQWEVAQTVVASTPLLLNPVQSIPMFSTPTKEALSIQPDGLIIEARPDLTADQILKMTGTHASDPTEELICPPGCDVKFTPAYSLLGVGVYYARSLDADLNRLTYDLQYEFENQILFRLAYNVNER
jgi:hypothetical protein